MDYRGSGDFTQGTRSQISWVRGGWRNVVVEAKTITGPGNSKLQM